MTNKKSTKRALLMSVLSLFLCVAMLTGTTFAWFTDSVSSKNNIIVAGNLDVELEYKKVKDGKLSDNWETVSGKKDIFDPNAYWEPGRTEVVYLKVSNLGSLALKYQLGVNVVKDKPGTNVDGKEFRLSEYLVFKTVILNEEPTADTYTRETAVVDGEAMGFKDYNGKTTALQAKSDDPAVNDEDYVALIVYMPESVGNVANHKASDDPSNPAKYAASIEFGINLFATQLAAEQDSFGPDYDEDAWVDGFKITTANDLQAAINNGVTNIVLENDIELTESLVIPAPATTTYALRTTTIVIDLNGKTISGATSDAMIVNEGVLTIKNGTVTNTAENGGATLYNKGTMTIDDLTVVGAPIAYASGNPSYPINNYGTMTVEDGTHVSSDRGAMYLGGTGETTINGGTFIFNDLSDKLDRSYTSHVIAVGSGSNNKLTINGGTFDHKHTKTSGGVVVCNMSATTVIVNGGNFSGGNYYGKWDNLSDYGWGATKTPFSVTGGTFTGFDNNYLATGYAAVQNADGTYSVIFPQDSFDSLIKNAGENATIEVPAGTYTFPGTDDLKAGQTLNCAPGTVFKGVSSMGINGATVIGATFDSTGNTNDNTGAGTGAVNGTFKNCTFTGNHGLRYCYAYEGSTVVFENCVFDADRRGVHFDAGKGEVIFRNCVINGFNAFGGELSKVTFEKCTFDASKHSYDGLNLYCNTVLTDCTYNFRTGKLNFIDMEGTGKTLTITNCTAKLDGEVVDIASYIGGNKLAQNTVTIDEVPLVASSETLNATLASGAKEILLAKGNYVMTDTAVGVTLKGVDKDKVVLNNSKAHAGNAGMNGSINRRMNFENLTFENTVFTMNGTGSVETGGGMSTFTNVNFAAGFRHAYGTDVVFTNCSFGSNSEGFALHFESDGTSTNAIQLNGCKFLGGMVHLGVGRTYAFTECDFAAGTDFQVFKTNIANLTNCTVDGVAVTAANIKTFFPDLILSNVIIDGACIVETSEALDAAMTSGAEEILLAKGDYTMPEPNLRGKTLTISGTKDTVIDVSNIDTRNQFVTGATLVFDGVTLNFNTDNGSWIYMGFANVKELTFRNCEMTGLQLLMADKVTFENCKIDSSVNTANLGQPHSVWTYSAKEVNFIGCDFIYGDRAVNVYLDNGSSSAVVNFNDCTFTTVETTSKGAIEINSSVFPEGVSVNFVDCTAPKYGTMVGISGWDSTAGATATITVDGTKIVNPIWAK